MLVRVTPPSLENLRHNIRTEIDDESLITQQSINDYASEILLYLNLCRRDLTRQPYDSLDWEQKLQRCSDLFTISRAFLDIETTMARTVVSYGDLDSGRSYYASAQTTSKAISQLIMDMDSIRTNSSISYSLHAASLREEQVYEESRAGKYA